MALAHAQVKGTRIAREYSSAVGDPYYPVPNPENRALYERYRELAAKESGVCFVGRLASYKYFNMDQAILNALEIYDSHISDRVPRDRTILAKNQRNPQGKWNERRFSLKRAGSRRRASSSPNADRKISARATARSRAGAHRGKKGTCLKGARAFPPPSQKVLRAARELPRGREQRLERRLDLKLQHSARLAAARPEFPSDSSSEHTSERV